MRRSLALLAVSALSGGALAACEDTRVGANISAEEARGEAPAPPTPGADPMEPPPADPTPTAGTPAVQRGDPAQQTEAADGLHNRPGGE